jgi:hypothetical protein
MFAVHCPTVGCPVLIWPSRLRGARNTDSGIRVAFTCACGAHAEILSGRQQKRAVLVSHPPAEPSRRAA